MGGTSRQSRRCGLSLEPIFGRFPVELLELLHCRLGLLNFGLCRLALLDRHRVVLALHLHDAIELALDEHTQGPNAEPDGLYSVIVNALFPGDGDVMTRAARVLSLI